MTFMFITIRNISNEGEEKINENTKKKKTYNFTKDLYEIDTHHLLISITIKNILNEGEEIIKRKIRRKEDITLQKTSMKSTHRIL